MDVLYLMIICSVSLAVIFLIIFIVGARSGQFDDDESPAVRMLLDSEIESNEYNTKNTENKEKDRLKNDTKDKI